jgi:hypothetical protein
MIMTMEHEQQLEQIQIDIDDAKNQIELAEALDRLHKNADFQHVILKEFLQNESIRIVGLKTDPGALEDVKQKQIDNVITSIGGLRQYFGKIYHMARNSQAALDEYYDTQKDILEEQMQDEPLQ